MRSIICNSKVFVRLCYFPLIRHRRDLFEMSLVFYSFLHFDSLCWAHIHRYFRLERLHRFLPNLIIILHSTVACIYVLTRARAHTQLHSLLYHKNKVYRCVSICIETTVWQAQRFQVYLQLGFVFVLMHAHSAST